MDLSLKNKNVLITGATGILGRVFSEALVKAGANIALVDRDQKSCDELAKELREKYVVQAEGYAFDITNEKLVVENFAKIIKDFKQIHVLHNNAAYKGDDLRRFFEPYENFSLQVWNEVMNVNVSGMFLMSRTVGEHMVKNKIQGSIIQTSSIYGVVGPDQRIYEGSEYLGMPINTPAVYSASKAAVVGLTKYLATYWGDKGIRVNTLTPGGMESGQNEVFKANYSRRVPLGRMGQPSELLGALLFLASDASSYVTGQNLIIDGGLTAW